MSANNGEMIAVAITIIAILGMAGFLLSGQQAANSGPSGLVAGSTVSCPLFKQTGTGSAQSTVYNSYAQNGWYSGQGGANKQQLQNGKPYPNTTAYPQFIIDTCLTLMKQADNDAIKNCLANLPSSCPTSCPVGTSSTPTSSGDWCGWVSDSHSTFKFYATANAACSLKCAVSSNNI